MMITMLLAFMDEEHKSIFIALYEENVEVMASAANKIIKNAADAEDTIMEVFEKLMKTPELILKVPEQKRRYYLITSAKNAARNKLNSREWKIMKENERNAKKYGSETGDFQEEDFMEFSIPDEQFVENIVINRVTEEEIALIVEKLPDKLKTIIAMKWYLGLENKEIADQMEITAEMVRSYLSRARHYLRQYVEQSDLENSMKQNKKRAEII